jgi:type I restriction enzyme S subunit
MMLLKDVPVCLTGRPLTFNQDIKALEPTAKMTAKFLAYSLTGNKHRLMNMVDCAEVVDGRGESGCQLTSASTEPHVSVAQSQRLGNRMVLVGALKGVFNWTGK